MVKTSVVGKKSASYKKDHKEKKQSGDSIRPASEYRVQYEGDDADKAAILSLMKKWYGDKFDSEDVFGRMTGADPGELISVSKPSILDKIGLTVYGNNYTMNRVIEDNGRKMYNAYFASYSTGSGTGTARFSRQVKELSRVGVERIEVSAAGRGDGIRGASGSFNGYYTWARFGYDGDIPLDSAFRLRSERSLPESARTATKFSQLMKTKQGRDWWRINGESWHGEFDLRPGSYSRKTLAAYLRERRSKR